MLFQEFDCQTITSLSAVVGLISLMIFICYVILRRRGKGVKSTEFKVLFLFFTSIIVMVSMVIIIQKVFDSAIMAQFLAISLGSVM